MIDSIKDALQTDIHYQIPDNYMRGAGDTYFSGKMLSKLARIIIVAEEIKVRVRVRGLERVVIDTFQASLMLS
jgi:esterase/lipase superfamily enzyme